MSVRSSRAKCTLWIIAAWSERRNIHAAMIYPPPCITRLVRIFLPPQPRPAFPVCSQQGGNSLFAAGSSFFWHQSGNQERKNAAIKFSGFCLALIRLRIRRRCRLPIFDTRLNLAPRGVRTAEEKGNVFISIRVDANRDITLWFDFFLVMVDEECNIFRSANLKIILNY